MPLILFFLLIVLCVSDDHWMDNIPNKDLDDSSLLKKAQHLRNEGKHNQASEIRDILLSHSPNHPYWHSLSAALYADDELYELAAYERNVTANLMINGYQIHRAEEQASFATNLIILNRLIEAEKAIYKSFDIIVDNPYAIKARAYLSWMKGENEYKVIRLLRLAISKAPIRTIASFKSTLASYFYYIGKWYLSLDIYKEIINEIEDAQYVKYKALYMVGRIYRELKLYKKANYYLLHSLNDRKKYENTNLEYLLYLLNTKQFNKFKKHLLKLSDEQMNIKWKWNTIIAYYYSLKGEFNKATNVFENNVLPNLPKTFVYFSKFHVDRVYFYLAKHYINMKNCKDAIKYLMIIMNDLRPKWSEPYRLYEYCVSQMDDVNYVNMEDLNENDVIQTVQVKQTNDNKVYF